MAPNFVLAVLNMRLLLCSGALNKFCNLLDPLDVFFRRGAGSYHYYFILQLWLNWPFNCGTNNRFHRIKYPIIWDNSSVDKLAYFFIAEVHHHFCNIFLSQELTINDHLASIFLYLFSYLLNLCKGPCDCLR